MGCDDIVVFCFVSATALGLCGVTPVGLKKCAGMRIGAVEGWVFALSTVSHD